MPTISTLLTLKAIEKKYLFGEICPKNSNENGSNVTEIWCNFRYTSYHRLGECRKDDDNCYNGNYFAYHVFLNVDICNGSWSCSTSSLFNSFQDCVSLNPSFLYVLILSCTYKRKNAFGLLVSFISDKSQLNHHTSYICVSVIKTSS